MAAVALAACALALGSAVPAGAKHAASPISFSFQGYANNVRVRPPLVAAFQLGQALIHGSGGIDNDNTLSGQFIVRTVPLHPGRRRTKFRGKTSADSVLEEIRFCQKARWSQVRRC